MLLDSSESIVFRTRLSWTILIPPILLTLVGLSCSACTWLIYIAEPPPGQEPPPQAMIDAFGNCSACIVVIAAIFLLFSMIRYGVSEVILTNRRLIKKTMGRTTEIFLDKVDSLAVENQLFGQSGAYGTLVVMSVGGSAQRFKNIRNVEVLRYQLLQQIEKRAGYKR